MNAKVIMQSGLTPECFMVQMWGIKACNGCEAKNRKTCGGKNILAKIKAGTFPEDGLPSCSPTGRIKSEPAIQNIRPPSKVGKER